MQSSLAYQISTLDTLEIEQPCTVGSILLDSHACKPLLKNKKLALEESLKDLAVDFIASHIKLLKWKEE